LHFLINHSAILVKWINQLSFILTSAMPVQNCWFGMFLVAE